jgi:hypothetical protein
MKYGHLKNMIDKEFKEGRECNGPNPDPTTDLTICIAASDQTYLTATFHINTEEQLPNYALISISCTLLHK